MLFHHLAKVEIPSLFAPAERRGRVTFLGTDHTLRLLFRVFTSERFLFFPHRPSLNVGGMRLTGGVGRAFPRVAASSRKGWCFGPTVLLEFRLGCETGSGLASRAPSSLVSGAMPTNSIHSQRAKHV
jgi:hypothetical protein